MRDFICILRALKVVPKFSIRIYLILTYKFCTFLVKHLLCSILKRKNYISLYFEWERLRKFGYKNVITDCIYLIEFSVSMDVPLTHLRESPNPLEESFFLTLPKFDSVPSFSTCLQFRLSLPSLCFLSRCRRLFILVAQQSWMESLQGSRRTGRFMDV